MNELATQNSQLATVATPAPLTVLDPYQGTVEVDAGRAGSLATISAGGKTDKGIPYVSRDGKIILHDPDGRASGLADALKATDSRSLTIALIHEPAFGGVQQKYTRYSQTALEMYGDETAITCLGVGKDGKTPVRRVIVHADEPEDFERARLTCKAETFLFFALAEWTEQGPQVIFPDGFGLYRLRFTSRNSARNLMAQLAHISRFTGGRIAGIPLTIRLQNQDVAGPDGKRRNVPVWQFTMTPPRTMRLTARDVQRCLSQGLGEAAMLALPAPSVSIDEVEMASAVDMDESDVRQLEQGAVDAAFFKRQYFAITRGSGLEDDELRAEFIEGISRAQGFEPPVTSLAEYLEVCTPAQAMEMIDRADTIAEALRNPTTPPNDLMEKLAASIAEAEAKRASESANGELAASTSHDQAEPALPSITIQGTAPSQGIETVPETAAAETRSDEKQDSRERPATPPTGERDGYDGRTKEIPVAVSDVDPLAEKATAAPSTATAKPSKATASATPEPDPLAEMDASDKAVQLPDGYEVAGSYSWSTARDTYGFALMAPAELKTTLDAKDDDVLLRLGLKRSPFGASTMPVVTLPDGYSIDHEPSWTEACKSFGYRLLSPKELLTQLDSLNKTALVAHGLKRTSEQSELPEEATA